jgi:uroporphyrinogen decarboxylase
MQAKMKIKHKRNIQAALECRQPETAVPIWELEFQAWDRVSGKHVILGSEFTKLSLKEKEKAVKNNADIMIAVAKELHFSALTMVSSYWEVSPGHPSYYWLPDEDKKKQNEILLNYCKEAGIATVGNCGGIISMPGSSTKYAEYCYKLYDAPEEIDDMVQKKYNHGIEAAKYCRDMGYDIILSCSDIADNKGPFYNPEQMERWFYPYLYKWSEEIKKMGMYSILHTDGYIMPVLERLADSELDALQAIDPVAGMDIKKVKEQVGRRLCICGNVETGLLVTGPKESIYENTRKILEECKSGGGLVLGASNASVPETPAEHYREMIRALEDYGMYI